jgi:hypothetical protein
VAGNNEDVINEEVIRAELVLAGITEDNVADHGFETLDDLVKALLANLDRVKLAFYDAKNQFEGFFAESEEKDLLSFLGDKFGDQITAKTAQSFSNTFGKIIASGGNYQAFADQLLSIYAEASNKEALMEIFQNTNWLDMLDVEAAVESMRQLGIVVDDDFVEKIKEATNAIDKVNVEELNKKIKSLGETLKEVTEKVSSGETVFDEKTYTKLIEAGIKADSFVQIGFDEYVFMGETNSILRQI